MGQKKRKSNEVFNGGACIFCGETDDNEDLFGKFYHRKDVSLHQNCMFFSSGLAQRGSRESDGILGFLIKDIKEECARGQKLRCCFCKNYGATIGCVVNNCRKTFHFPCGVKNRVLSQHFGNFSSFCQSHKPKQNVVKIKDEPYCHICSSSLSRDELDDCLYSPCCKNNWFHRCCLQKYALSAGMHFFKCPLCNNSSKFIKEMNKFGICVPNKDAAWELESNAYGELLYRPECSATTCNCRSGRNYNGEGVWELLACEDCGAYARHRHCENLDALEEKWICNDCQAFEATKQVKNISLDKEKDGNDSIADSPPPVLEVIEPSCSYSHNTSSDLSPPDLSFDDKLIASSCVVVLKDIYKIENYTSDCPPHLSYEDKLNASSCALKDISEIERDISGDLSLPDLSFEDKLISSTCVTVLSDICKVEDDTDPPELSKEEEIFFTTENLEEKSEFFVNVDPPMLSVEQELDMFSKPEEVEEFDEKFESDPSQKLSVEKKVLMAGEKVNKRRTSTQKNNCLKDHNSLEPEYHYNTLPLFFGGKTLKREASKPPSKQKRRKIMNDKCCSGNNQCIRKMFGFNCQNCSG